MANLRIKGDTSGYVDLVAPDVAGSQVINLDRLVETNSNGQIIVSTDTEHQLTVQSATSGAGGSLKVYSAGGYAYHVTQNNSREWRFGSLGGSNFTITDWSAGPIERLVIKSNGNVGIGTTDPSAPLDVVSNSASGYVAEFRESNAANFGTIVIDSPTDGESRPSYMDYATGGTVKWSTGLAYLDAARSFHIGTGSGTSNSKVTITTDGKLGVGTTNPGEKLHVYGSGQQFIKVETTTTGAAAFVGLRMQDGDGDLGSIGDFGSGRRALMLDTGSGVDMMFFTNNQNNSSDNPRLTITSGGKLLVNTTNPQDFQETIVMVGESAYLGGVYLGKVKNSSNNTSAAILVHKLGQGQGFQFSGKFIINSWTGNKNIDCHVTAYYTNDSVSVNTNHVNTGGVASSTVRLCTVSYDGFNWLAFVKDGGGSGVAYLNAFLEGNIHFNGGVREITSGYSITTTHTSF